MGPLVMLQGIPLPDETLALCKRSDAILPGCDRGGPNGDQLPVELRPEIGALPLGKELALLPIFGPASFSPAFCTLPTLKEEVIKGVDILVIRELTGDCTLGKRSAKRLVMGAKGHRHTHLFHLRDRTHCPDSPIEPLSSAGAGCARWIKPMCWNRPGCGGRW